MVVTFRDPEKPNALYADHADLSMIDVTARCESGVTFVPNFLIIKNPERWPSNRETRRRRWHRGFMG